MSHYAGGNRAAGWRKSKIAPSSCVALVEVVNLTSKFVSFEPHIVVNNTNWLVWYELLLFSPL